MDKKTQRKTNPVLQDTIRVCEAAARKHDAQVWADVAAALKTANREQIRVNLSDLNRHVEDGETIVVPGKVMGSGSLKADVTVAAFQFTQDAREAVEAAGNGMYIDELVDDNPDGSEVRIIR